MFEHFCNWIILIASTITAISAVLRWFGKPIVLFKKKRKEEEENLKKQFATDIKNEISKEITPKLDILLKSSQDSLRKQILEIYEQHKNERKLTESQKETLDELYEDYINEKGNGYIKKKYLRVAKWTIVPDDNEEDEKTEI